MDGEVVMTLVISILVLIGSAFFVAGEYALVGARRTKIEALAKKGNRSAKQVLKALDNISVYVAGTQVAITLCGIATGSVTEPYLHGVLEKFLGFLPVSLIKFLSIIVVALPLVILGELVPKYAVLANPERAALATSGPLRFLVMAVSPLIWLTRKGSELTLRPFGISMDGAADEVVSREELSLLIEAGKDEGHFEESQATVIHRALKLDRLDAADVMVHRLDIKWIADSQTRAEISQAMRTVAHSRIPVCGEDIDDVLGVVYLQDLVRHWDEEDFSLSKVLRPAVFVPESLTLDRIVQLMRQEKTQILFVRDEYGGTAGLLTLEDVVEEVFGELEDSLESERPPIERTGPNRVTARADVRYDELLEFLGVEPFETGYTTEGLAEIVAQELGNVPKLGDSVTLPIGRLRVENMARRRVTRLLLLTDPPSPTVDTAQGR
ncbi:MAG: HlyC/CorC family transporter [Armatimonadetes bacterium]|nr:HlyC/CorC family transporter [Armatimonadota bacterium]